MRIEVKLFAVARQVVGADAVAVQLAEGATVGDLRAALASAHPPLADILPHVLFAVDAEYATDATSLSPASEVACIPPVSGG